MVHAVGCGVILSVGGQSRVVHVSSRHLVVVSHHAVRHSSRTVELCRDVELPLLERRQVTHRYQSLELVLQRFFSQFVAACGGVERGLPYVVVAEGSRHCPAAQYLH